MNLSKLFTFLPLALAIPATMLAAPTPTASPTPLSSPTNLYASCYALVSEVQRLQGAKSTLDGSILEATKTILQLNLEISDLQANNPGPCIDPEILEKIAQKQASIKELQAEIANMNGIESKIDVLIAADQNKFTSLGCSQLPLFPTVLPVPGTGF